jgi:hypothetical protein
MDIDINIEDKFNVTIPSTELVNPLRGLNSEGKFAVQPAYNEIAIFRSDPIEDSAVLGKVFLSQVSRTNAVGDQTWWVREVLTGFLLQVYLFVDWEKDSFSLGRQKQRADVAPIITSSATCASPISEQKGLGPRDIGYISGLAVLAAIVIALVFVVARKRPAPAGGETDIPLGPTGGGPPQPRPQPGQPPQAGSAPPNYHTVPDRPRRRIRDLISSRSQTVAVGDG